MTRTRLDAFIENLEGIDHLTRENLEALQLQRLNEMLTRARESKIHYENLPEKLEKSFNFVCGFFSGMLLATLLIFCAFSILPNLFSGDTLELKQERTALARKYASNILTAGNIFTFSYFRGDQQKKVLEKLVPVPVEKKIDKVSAGKNRENRKNTSKQNAPRQKQEKK